MIEEIVNPKASALSRCLIGSKPASRCPRAYNQHQSQQETLPLDERSLLTADDQSSVSSKVGAHDGEVTALQFSLYSVDVRGRGDVFKEASRGREVIDNRFPIASTVAVAEMGNRQVVRVKHSTIRAEVACV